MISMKLLFPYSAWTIYVRNTITTSRLAVAVDDPFGVVFDHFFTHFGRYLADNWMNVGFQRLQR